MSPFSQYQLRNIVQDILSQLGLLVRLERKILGIGLASFLAPCVSVMAFAYWVAGWSLQASQVAGIALCATAVAVAYTVLVEHGSAGALKVVRTAMTLAQQHGAELHEISVEEHLPRYGALMGEVIEAKREARDFFYRVMQEAEAAATALDLRLTSHVMPGHPVEAIAAFVKNGGFDLLVIGFTGHSNIFGRIWGGTSQDLTRLSPCTVLVVT